MDEDPAHLLAWGYAGKPPSRGHLAKCPNLCTWQSLLVPQIIFEVKILNDVFTGIKYSSVIGLINLKASLLR